MEQMQAMSMSWIEVQFLRKAVDVLSSCRRTLMYTYAFAFYLQRDNEVSSLHACGMSVFFQAAIFEANQGDLEQATEQLSEFLERDIDNENLVTLKQKASRESKALTFQCPRAMHFRCKTNSGMCNNDNASCSSIACRAMNANAGSLSPDSIARPSTRSSIDARRSRNNRSLIFFPFHSRNSPLCNIQSRLIWPFLNSSSSR
jgi:hypothetical protein